VAKVIRQKAASPQHTHRSRHPDVFYTSSHSAAANALVRRGRWTGEPRVQCTQPELHHISPLKSVSFHWRTGRTSNTNFPETTQSASCTLHPDRFSCFCTVQPCAQHTQTDRQRYLQHL